MLTREDVESYLLRTELSYDEVEEGLFVVQMDEDGGARLVVNHSPPVLVFRLKVLDVPKDQAKCSELYRRLLELNGTDLVHAAYALEGSDVILSETLELENLDFNEFQATVDSFQLALASHLEVLSPYRDC
ncbi:MAG TPA: CesT family type III secretion system chaperone [Longimicrobiaceae bacterium]|nr:CesT family type III secretion system chaperone [Longimicrobiaceae bacterium]